MKRFWRYWFPPLYGLLVYFTIRLLLDSVTGMKFWKRDWTLNATEIPASIIIGYIFVWSFDRLLRYFDKHSPADVSYKRVIRELLYVFLFNLVFQNVFLTPIAAFTDDGLQWYDVVDINTIPLLYAIIYYGIKRSSMFLKAYIDNRVLLEKITNDQLETELKFLKAQYHPHFLFNALNTIYFQMDEDVAEAKKSVEKFSELLRYQLYNQQQTVPVSQEIHYLQNFIQLQQIRSSLKLQLAVHFDEKLNGQQIYPLLFLPLVENAFKYVGGNYRLCIGARVLEGGLEFKVENSVPSEIPVKKEGGIGLENLKRRLELLYPGRHTLVADKKNDTFTATLNIVYN
jgi:two-component system LytT family sensor kinase